MLEENGIQNGHKLMSFYFFIKSIFKNLHGMLSISLKLYSFSSNKAVLKQSLVLLGTLDFTGSEQWATFNFPQFTVLSNEFLCFQIVVPSLTKKSHFCDIINNYYSDITNMKFENFSIYSL